MQQQLKQRLVGAVVLVGGAALLLPWLLGEPPPRRDAAEAVRAVSPAPPTLVSPPSRFTAGSAAVPAPLPDDDDLSAGMPGPAQVPPPSPAPVAVGPAPALVVDGERADDGRGPVPVPASDIDGWAIQLASFSQEDNAENLRERLAGQGQRTFIERSDDGAHVRVLVGPFASRALAEEARRALAALTGLDGVLRETGRP